jgi:hypothetical protein
MNGGHAHADALSMALTLANRPLLVDPGTSTYTVDPTVRDRMRRSMNHNTVTIDGRSQSMPAGPFQWQTRADARMHDWRHNAAFDWLEASHDGYAPVRHRRSLLRIGQAGWLVADEILGSGRHAAAAHWHFDPAWMLTCEPGRLRAAHAMGGIAWLLHDAGAASLAHGDERSGLGWYAPTYGTLMPTWSACVAVEDEAPFAVLTWIGEGDATAPPPVLERLSAACDARAPVIAARVSAGDRSSIVMLRPGEPAARADRACRLPDYDTDARALHYASAGETLLALDLVDARTVAAARDGWVSIDADMPIADLHVGLESGALDLRASVPPPRLRLRSTRTVYTVRLNGRDLPIAAARADAALLIHGDDWGAPDPARTRPAHPWLDSGAAFAQH